MSFFQLFSQNCRVLCNKSLKNRGNLSLYFPEGDLKSQFINEEPYMPGISGRLCTYTPAYIELIYTF